MKALLCLFFASVLAASLSSCANNSEANANIKPYSFATCAVINRPLKGKTIIRRVDEGQEMRFCRVKMKSKKLKPRIQNSGHSDYCAWIRR